MMNNRRIYSVATLTLTWVCMVAACNSFVIQPQSWDYKGHRIAYEEARQTYNGIPDDSDKDHAPILILNGFGVGSFHQHRVMPQLLAVENNDYMGDVETAKDGNNRVVYGVDYLGQGGSWPVDCDDGNSPNEKGLIYSADTWVDQLIRFMEDVILPNHQGKNGEPCKIHLVGNSVGGHLSVVLAARRPDLIDSICLLNATPVWGLNLPGWSGHLPPPSIPRIIGRYLFDRIRDLNTIEKYLENAYANREAFNEELCHQIRGCTEGKGGHAAFASILFSPPAAFPWKEKDFYSNLSKLECDVLLMFGANDPWCKPSFARRMYDSLQQRQNSNDAVHRYIELDNVGHCPNHEAPQAVGEAVRRWAGSSQRHNSALTLVDGKEKVIEEPWGKIVMKELTGEEANMSFLDKLFTKLVG